MNHLEKEWSKLAQIKQIEENKHPSTLVDIYALVTVDAIALDQVFAYRIADVIASVHQFAIPNGPIMFSTQLISFDDPYASSMPLTRPSVYIASFAPILIPPEDLTRQIMAALNMCVSSYILPRKSTAVAKLDAFETGGNYLRAVERTERALGVCEAFVDRSAPLAPIEEVEESCMHLLRLSKRTDILHSPLIEYMKTVVNESIEVASGGGGS